MVTIGSHPDKTVHSGEITVTLDREYKLLLRKYINGETKYEAEVISPEDVSDEVKKVVVGTAIGYCNREGVWG